MPSDSASAKALEMDDIRCLIFISEASVACHANKAQAVNIVHFQGLDKS